MIRSYWRGLRAASARWPLTVVLWLVALAFGTAFALAAAYWLDDALGASLATRTLFKDLDANVLVDLYFHHRQGARMLAPFAALLALAYLALWLCLHGVVVASVRARDAAARDTLRRGLETTPVYGRLFLCAAVVLAVFSAAVYGATRAGRRWAGLGSTAFLVDAIGVGGATVWLLGYVFLTAVHDHARLRTSVSGEPALSAYRWACAFVWRGGERAFLLALLLQLSALGLWAGFQLLGPRVSAGAFGIAWSLVWGELFLLVRMWVRIWFFAAQNELH